MVLARLPGDRAVLRKILMPALPVSARQSAAVRTFFTEVSGGFARSFAIVVFAVLTNHVRRMVFPSLGVGGFGGPIATLKLAVGSPDIFLQEEIDKGFFGRNSGREGLWKVFGDFVGGFVLMYILVGSCLRWDANRTWFRSVQKWETGEMLDMQDRDFRDFQMDVKEKETRRREARWLRKVMVPAAVVYVVWILGCAEYIHARAVHVVAVGIAYFKLLRGGPAHQEALIAIFLPSSTSTSHSSHSHIISFQELVGMLKILGFHLELASYIIWGLYPLLRLAIRTSLRRNPQNSRPALAFLIAGWAWGTGYVTRYSNKYYIGLEMSGLLLVLWWTLAAGVVFGWNALRAWLKQSS